MSALRVAPEEALQRVTAAAGNLAADAKLNFDSVDLNVEPGNLVELVGALKDTQGIECTFFTFLSGVDRTEFGEEKGGFEVLLHLYSPEHVIHVTVHVPVDPANPVCPTLTGVYAGAFWHERETHEMFGIDFEGHPRLVNLYLPEDFEGYPLRKTFKLPSRFVKEWPGAKDPEEAAAGGR